jgi:dienelactone hydrolase
MIPRIHPLLIVALWLASAAHVSDSLAQSTSDLPQRGQLLDNSPQLLGLYSPSDLISKITDGTVSRWLLRYTFSPQCSVAVYQMRYGTIGAQGEPTSASAALMVPSGSDYICQKPRPIVLYAHGKRNLTFFNIADLSGQSNYEGLTIALSLAADGYIVVAPNYAGYDTSTLGYHPFMNADQQSADMIDALTAARLALPAADTADAGKLFVTGYSEGGYVAMATHRALEAAGMPITASAPMSGPYALSAFSDAMFLGQVGRGAVEEILMLASSYQHAYGSIDSGVTQMFEPQYASAHTLLPGPIGTGTLVAQGLIPESAVFSSEPPFPEAAWATPATTPSKLADVFARGFGTDHLITNAYRTSYLQDANTAPDGGYPNTTTGLPPDSPADPLRQALKQNDLRNWAPIAPMLLCAGDEDPVVFYLNTQLMQGYWAVTAPESPVTVLDIDAPPSQDGPYQHLRKRFAQTKSLLKLIEGRSAAIEEYHDVLVPAFCLQATKSYFDGF